jgi:hypothetical protein
MSGTEKLLEMTPIGQKRTCLFFKQTWSCDLAHNNSDHNRQHHKRRNQHPVLPMARRLAPSFDVEPFNSSRELKHPSFAIRHFTPP